jgi:valyl-tRNA synthetase
MGMMLCAPAGNDILFDESLCEQGRNFNNKIWNAFRLVKGWQVSDTDQSAANKVATEWFAAQLRKTSAEVDDLFKKYRISEALMAVYQLFWDEFSSWYLEMVKPAYGSAIDRTTYDATLGYFDTLLKMLHPFMPFITEELWQHLYDREEGDSIMREQLKLGVLTATDEQLIAQMETVKAVVSGVRTIRSTKNIAPKEQLDLLSIGHDFVGDQTAIVEKMANLKSLSRADEKPGDAAQFMVGTTEWAVPLGSLIDVDAEIAKQEAQLKHLEGFLMGVEKKLSNERFVANAPEAVVALERKKQHDAQEKIAALKESLAKLRG